MEPGDGGGDAQALIAERDRLAREHGPWQDRVKLGHGVHTGDPEPGHLDRRLAAFVQAAGDALGRDLRGARVLDLGAAEGRYAVEFALQGAEVVAIEGRRGNFEKARFLKEALGLDRLEVVQADVRTLSREAYGVFDVVLCLGLLYHLEGEAAVRLLQRLAAVTGRLLVLDTLYARSSSTQVEVDGHAYRGRRIREFDPDESEASQEQLGRSSIGNPESLWLTAPSIYNALRRAGFTTIAEMHVPRLSREVERFTLLAFRGERRDALSAPGAERLEPLDWPERERRRRHRAGTAWGSAKLRLAPYAPTSLKRWVRRRRGVR